ncbi:hypothetical protein L6R50_24135 [Myxococcota bacterium]|nr:hypothetical protein [Myxococcota bacterium]
MAAFLLGALVGATGCQDTGGPGDDDATALDDDGSPDDDSVPDDDATDDDVTDDDATDDDTADDDAADDDSTPPGWVPTLPCEEPPPWGCPGDPDCDGVPAPEDCDDADGRTWPGARETCGDGRDQDCDGVDVECWLSGERAVTLDDATVTARITSTRPWTQIGSAVVPLGDVTGDGEADLFVEGSVYGPACILAGPLVGLIEIADDDSNCAVELDLLRPYSSKLYAVDPGNVNGDGVDDLVVGYPDDGPVGEEPGYVYLFHGPLGGWINAAQAALVIEGDAPSDHAGYGLSVGDVDGDGAVEILAMSSSHGAGEGRAALFKGARTGSVHMADADLLIDGVPDLMGLDKSSDMADVDGDGRDDLLLEGSYFAAVEGEWHYAVFVFYAAGLTWGGSRTLDEADAILLASPEINFGEELHGVDAAQNRGCGAIVASRVWIDDETAGVAVVYGAPTGIHDVTDVGVLLTGSLGDAWGTSLAADGDANGDGWADLLVGAFDEEEFDEGGSLYLFHGPLAGDGTVSDSVARLHGVGMPDVYGGWAGFGDPSRWIPPMGDERWGVVSGATGQDRTADPDCDWYGSDEGWEMYGCQEGAVYLLMPP